MASDTPGSRSAASPKSPKQSPSVTYGPAKVVPVTADGEVIDTDNAEKVFLAKKQQKLKATNGVSGVETEMLNLISMRKPPSISETSFINPSEQIVPSRSTHGPNSYAGAANGLIDPKSATFQKWDRTMVCLLAFLAMPLFLTQPAFGVGFLAAALETRCEVFGVIPRWATLLFVASHCIW